MARNGRSERNIRSASCLCCGHPERARLELLRVSGVSLDALAREFKISRDSVFRHFKNHVSERRRAELLAGPARVHDLANAAAKESKSLLEYLAIMRGVLFNQFLAAAETNDRQGVVNVASQLLSALRDLGKVTGELRALSGITVNHNTINIGTAPEFIALQEGLLDIARAIPEARDPIIQLIRRVVETPKKPNGSPYPALIIEGEAIEQMEAASAD